MRQNEYLWSKGLSLFGDIYHFQHYFSNETTTRASTHAILDFLSTIVCAKLVSNHCLLSLFRDDKVSANYGVNPVTETTINLSNLWKNFQQAVQLKERTNILRGEILFTNHLPPTDDF